LLFSVFIVVGCRETLSDAHVDYQGQVTKVVDGDSLYIDGNKTQIRLFGVDAPERDEPGYEASRQYLIDLSLNKYIACVEVERDKYDRIVARCNVGRVDVNHEMISAPYTLEYCRFSNNYYGTCR